MNNYGTTIRKIRINKGFSHKETYTGILSKSYAIDFEKGLYDIKFSLMLKILNRLMISVDELLLIHNDFQINISNEPLMDINLDKFKNDLTYATKIEKSMRDEYAKTKTSQNKLKLMEILALKLFYESEDYKKSIDFQTAKKYIQKYLFDIESWTFSEFRIFSDMSFIFDDGDVKTSLFLCAWKSLEKYKQHPDFKIYLSHLLVNNLYRLIYAEQYELAKKAIKRLHELTQDDNMLSWKVPLYFLEGVYDYMRGNYPMGLEKINKAKLIYSTTENRFMLEQMEIGIKIIQEKVLNK